MVRLVSPNELRADYLYSTDNQRQSNVCTPMAILPPASPLLGGMPSPNLHDKNINF